ncbi:MAG: hypothetical protein ACFFCZ_31480 [Promethearchaeota archaeon]
MVSKIRQIIESCIKIMPACPKPERELLFTQRLTWTIGALVVYFLLTVIPIYGVGSLYGEADPFFWTRTLTASSRGTLAELGIGPLVTAVLIMQLLVRFKVIPLNMSKPEERTFYIGTQKVLAVVLTIFQALASILGGNYPNAVGNMNLSLVIFIQLVIAGILIILLDELVQGWGLGSGIALFIAGGVAQNIFWNALAPIPAVGVGNELEIILIPDSALQDGTLRHGAILALFQAIQAAIAVGVNALKAIAVLIIRPGNTPGLLSVISTGIILLLVLYFEIMYGEIPRNSAESSDITRKYPIKLLYVSTISLILALAVLENAYYIAQMLWNTSGREHAPLLIKLLGNFQAEATRYVPVPGCLVYYLTPPQGMLDVFDDFLRAIVYALVLVGLCIVFSVIWIENAEINRLEIPQELIDAGVQKTDWQKELRTTAMTGGLIIGLLAAFAEFIGPLVSGAGLVLAVSIMWYYSELFVKKKTVDAPKTPEIRLAIKATVAGLGLVGIIGYVIKIGFFIIQGPVLSIGVKLI